MAHTSALNRLLLHAVIIVIGLFMLYPIIWLISSSFKPSQLIFTDLSLWPKAATLNNYIAGWSGISRVKFSTFLINSLIVSALCVLGNLASCSMAAYAFGRLDFNLKKLWFAIMLVTIMLPHHVTIIPQYILFKQLNWIDTYYPLTIPKWLATDAFFIFLMVQFIRGLPKELDESATIDGCGQVQIFCRIILPLAVPALITTGIFTFLWTWDDFFSQLLYINTAKLYTIPLGLRLFMDSSGDSNWGAMFAMSVLSLVPSLVIFFSCQKYFVEGISTSGIKG
ncbi:carbohydrate ABC transporter permease [Paenibacillus thalictri]|uniref:Carbohydrate ABC transporter permease n=1 Tax=Paenibacillus thalictri TaxID=2527873 RepID=A0A4Q9DNR5_9BACL|nr:carbohydrate ABC transporter permease [Paenibacillus thalictri]TBL74541.1 carbohydrate ABC transporter permease [Paenibacillus thalictri]